LGRRVVFVGFFAPQSFFFLIETVKNTEIPELYRALHFAGKNTEKHCRFWMHVHRSMWNTAT